MKSDLKLSRAQAAAALGIAEDAGPAKATSAFLHRLRRAGFSIPFEWRAALDEYRFSRWPTRGMAAEVAAFVAEYWNLSPPARRQRWGELRTWCNNGTVEAAWLDRLEPGVDVPAHPKNVDGDVARLAAMIQKTFIAHPREQSFERMRHLTTLRTDLKRWRAAAELLGRILPSHAVLGGRMLEGLQEEVPSHAVDLPPAVSMVPTGAGALAAPLADERRSVASSADPALSPPRSWGTTAFWAIILISILTRAFNGVHTRNAVSPRQQPWQVHQPAPNPKWHLHQMEPLNADGAASTQPKSRATWPPTPPPVAQPVGPWPPPP